MLRFVIRILKSGIQYVLGLLGYRLVRVPKGPPVISYPDWDLLGIEPLDNEVNPNPSHEAGRPLSLNIGRLHLGPFASAAVAFINEQKRDGKQLVHLQHQYRRDLKIDQPAIRIIGGDWLKNIGQIAHLDTYFKLKALGMLEPSETIVCLDGIIPANKSLLSYFAPFVRRFVPNRAALGELAEFAGLFEESTSAVHLTDGRAEHYHGLFYDVAVAWQQQARPPLISLRPSHRATGRQWLSSLGLPDDGWFATFHCRTGKNHQDLRSVRPETYTRAMEAVIRAGGWVVCMGTPSLAGLVDAHPKILNRQDHHTPAGDWKDVFLLADCRFFVGCTSGPADVVNAFGVPSIITNTVQLGSQAAHNHDLLIPKLFLSRKTGRLLTMAEILEHVDTACGSEPSHLADLEIDIVDNTPEEIEAVVCEMIERLDGTTVDVKPWEEAAQRRLREFRQYPGVGPGPLVAGKTRMGRDFLRRNAIALGLGDS